MHRSQLEAPIKCSLRDIIQPAAESDFAQIEVHSECRAAHARNSIGYDEALQGRIGKRIATYHLHIAQSYLC